MGKKRKRPGSGEQREAFLAGEGEEGGTKRKGLTISAPNFRVAEFPIRGTSILCVHKMSQKVREQIKRQQELGDQATKNVKREPKDFKANYEGAKRKAKPNPDTNDKGGWLGIAAPAFRNAMISACKVCGFAMTRAKLSVFVLADGIDDDDAMPLVKITKGEPRYLESPVRNADKSVDLRARPIWDPGWEAVVRVRYDADQFSELDVANLMMRVGCQVGLCEGRPDSKKSAGLDWGLFELIDAPSEEQAAA